MDTRKQRRAPGALWVGVVVVMLLAGCGGGAGSSEGGGAFDRAGAEAAVNEGKQALVDLLNDPDLNTKTVAEDYGAGTGIAGFFDQAGKLDPTYEEGAFWSALATLVTFLESDEAKSFLAKLGWEDLHLEIGDFAERIGQSFGAGYTGATGGAGGGEDPPLQSMYMPNDPDTLEEPNLCIENPVVTEGCVVDSNGFLPFDVYLFGVKPNSDVSFISFQELYDFLTGTLGNAVHGAVVKLKGISSGFSTTIMAIPFGEVGQFTITFDKLEADVLQVAYGLLDVALSLPTLWTWTGIDQFIAANSTRDESTGKFVEGVDGNPIDPIDNAELAAFIQAGNDGIAGNAEDPLRSNPAGIARLTGALSDLLGAAQSLLLRIGADGDGDPLTGHVVTMATMFTGYDEQPKVMSYAARAFASTVGEVRASLSAPTNVHVYLPVATIQSFDACPVGGKDPDLAIHNQPDGAAFPLTEAGLGPLAGTAPLDGSNGTASILLDDLSPEYTPGVHVVKITVPGATNLSFFTQDAGGSVDVDTAGNVAYANATNDLVAWDSDGDSGPGLHFGMSLDSAYYVDDPQHMAGIAASGPYVFYVSVQRPAGESVTLEIRSNTTGNWPSGAPIFLKGGEGRQFLAHTYSVGSLRVNAGEAIKTVSQFWDLSHRDSFQFIPDPDPANPDDPGEVPSLMFDAGVIKNRVKAVLPDADFTGSVLSDDPAAQIDIFNETPLDFGLGGDLLTAVPQAEDAQFGTLTFCAYPYSLSTSNTVTGGYMAVGF